jgi:predicted GIY-YIG superfamily endonuclease
MKQNGVRKVTPDATNPLVVLLLDETLPLTDLLKKGTDSPLGRVAYTGAAAAYVVWANTQVAQVDSIGRFRDLIPQRICFATPNPQVTDSVLGQGAEASGAKCSEIRTAGVGYSHSEGDVVARKFRGAMVTDDETKLIAMGKLPAAVMEMAEMETTAKRGETALYRHFDAEGRLLYVGITNNYARRSGEHADDKPWWRDVARSEVERYPTRKAAMDAEKAAIESEHPLDNDQHNKGNPRRRIRKTDLRIDKRLSTRREQQEETKEPVA